MGRPFWAQRRGGNPDANQAGIVDLARELGATVEITSKVGFDFPDLVIGFRGVTVLAEVTNPARKPTKKDRERKARQAAFRSRWRGGPVVELKTGDDLVQLLTGPDMVRWIREQGAMDGTR